MLETYFRISTTIHPDANHNGPNLETSTWPFLLNNTNKTFFLSQMEYFWKVQVKSIYTTWHPPTMRLSVNWQNSNVPNKFHEAEFIKIFWFEGPLKDQTLFNHQSIFLIYWALVIVLWLLEFACEQDVLLPPNFFIRLWHSITITT